MTATRPRPSRRRRLLVPGVLALWVLVCFGFALRLPFFWDDLPIMTWIARHGWGDILLSTENAYYRPLAFAVYRLGASLPLALRAPLLHAANLFFLWVAAALLYALTRLADGSRERALITALLFVAVPFLGESIPWITALSHPLVTALTLLAAYGALRAAQAGDRRLWLLSLAATGLAPLAHEGGAVAGLIVAGVVLVERGPRCRPRCRAWLAAGVGLDLLLVAARGLIPGAHTGTALAGLPDFIPNIVYFVQGALYPLGPLLGALVLDLGYHDFTVILLFASLLLILLTLLWRSSGRWRWMARGFWWMAVAALPVIVSIDYNGLFVSTRLYTLASVGSAIIWGGLIAEAGALGARLTGRRRSRHLIRGVLTLLVLAPGLLYLSRYRGLYRTLDRLYTEVEAVAAAAEGPVAFVNLPAALSREARVYPLVTEHVVFVSTAISDLDQYLAVNVGPAPPVRTAVYGPLFQETDPFWLSQGPWLEGEQMRRFLLAHESVWLARYREETGRFELRAAGTVAPAGVAFGGGVARFEGGTILQAAEWAETGARRFAVTLTWRAAGPVPATTFLHVRDATGALVAQADGAALGGLLPLPLWRAGDRIADVRHLTLPPESVGPYTVQVGLYDESGRLPAYTGATRVPKDAVTVATLPAP